jgi:hypothetical protein
VQNIVLGMQGGRASGSEQTFDGQAMQPGIHLRWSFTPELGFPPGGFWLCRRVAQPGEQQIPLPGMAQRTTPPMNRIVVTIAPDPETNQCLANLQPACSSVVIEGHAVPGQANVTLTALVKNQAGEFAEMGNYTVPIVNGLYRAQIIGNRIDALRMANVQGVEQCLCIAAD